MTAPCFDSWVKLSPKNKLKTGPGLYVIVMANKIPNRPLRWTDTILYIGQTSGSIRARVARFYHTLANPGSRHGGAERVKNYLSKHGELDKAIAEQLWVTEYTVNKESLPSGDLKAVLFKLEFDCLASYWEANQHKLPAGNDWINPKNSKQKKA